MLNDTQSSIPIGTQILNNFNNVPILQIDNVQLKDILDSREKLNAILYEYGIPFSVKRVFKMSEDIKKKLEAYKQLQIDFVKKSYFPGVSEDTKQSVLDLLEEGADYNGRSIKYTHINSVLMNLYKFPRDYLVSSSKYYTTTKTAYVKVKTFVELELGLDGRLLNYVLDVKSLLQKQKGLKQILDLISYNDVDLEKKEIVYLHPNLEFTETYRVVTSNPNIQGKTGEIKSLIEAPKGYKFITLDISGQEVHILLNGILEDKKLLEYYIELGDPYFAILKRVGLEPTKENKKIAKIPVLGIMNGMGKQRAIEETNNPDFVNKIYNLITQDSGFIKKVTTYTEQQIAEAKTTKICTAKGLLGGCIREFIYYPKGKWGVPKGEKYNDPKTTLQNGFFQITAAEITGYSMLKFMDYIFDNVEGGFNSIRPVVTIHDEFVIMCKDEFEEKAIELTKKFLLPIVRDWSRFEGEILVSNHYVHK